MAIAMRSNGESMVSVRYLLHQPNSQTSTTKGLHHAVSLGTFEVGSKSTSKSQQVERSYDSDDENMSRRRLRHTSSTELYARPSIYSKGDIREQYCLTDRQVHTIERSRRDRFFGCLSRRATPQSFLGGCVGRRAPSDENLNAYAPFYRYPRYPHQVDKNMDAEMETTYFRRQPASILSSSKSNADATNASNRYSWVGSAAPINPTQAQSTCQQQQQTDHTNYTNEQSTSWLATPPIDTCYQDIIFMNCLELQQYQQQQQQQQQLQYYYQNQQQQQQPQHNNADDNHLDNFSNINCCSYQCPSTSLVGLTAAAQAQLGQTPSRTKHVSFARSHTLTSFDDVSMGMRSSTRINGARSQERLLGGKKANATYMSPTTTMTLLPAQAVLQQPCTQHAHGHAHQHHHTPIHIHPYVSTYSAGVQVGQPMAGGVNILAACPMTQTLRPTSPEVVVIEKKFRNAMKTQATQTERGKDELPKMLALSPRTIHKVKVVSQSAQTNGMQNGKKLTKSLSEMPNGSNEMRNLETAMGIRAYEDHELLHRTQSEEPPHSPLEVYETYLESPSNMAYYQPPPPLQLEEYEAYSSNNFYMRDEENFMHEVDVHAPTTHFDFESNSLPRRTCTFHRMESVEYNSNSLPRTDPLQSYELCKHITECSELMGATESSVFDFSKPPLLSPPSQYCKSDEEDDENHKFTKEVVTSHRRKSMIPLTEIEPDSPFKRDDVRRQSMPVFVKTEKLIDGQGFRSSFRSKYRIKTIVAEPPEEKEIFIDFKPNLILEPLPRNKKTHKSTSKSEHTLDTQTYMSTATEECEECAECASLAAAMQNEPVESEDEREDPVYENVPISISKPMDDLTYMNIESKRNQYRKRSVSLDEAQEQEEKVIAISGPPSPYREEILENASTYPSSDSLANDTRDHSDGIWNESQVTVLTAEHKESSDNGAYSSNLLLTPSSRRKNLLLVHQQRSSIDTDVFDLEEGFMEHGLTYSNTLKPIPSPSVQPSAMPRTEEMTKFVVPTKMGAPSIAVTHSSIDLQEPRSFATDPSPMNSRRSSRTLPSSPLEVRKTDTTLHRNSDTPSIYLTRSDNDRDKSRFNADVSECSTNTDEYGTCTDNSKRTPGIKTPPTTTSSSSATQVPVSTQSSQMDKTHEGSSFESASSLYSTREFSLEEAQTDKLLVAHGPSDSIDKLKRSPSHSVSSVSSGSYNVGALMGHSPIRDDKKSAAAVAVQRDKSRMKPDSISDDDRSELRYSSSGYYESPRHQDYTACRANRRTRCDEDRKRKKTSMKLNIEKENMRALTSPIKKSQSTVALAITDKSPDTNAPLPPHVIEITSPNRMKRIRPKIRRQLRKTKNDTQATAVSPHEKLLDSSMKQNQDEEGATKPIRMESDCGKLKAKSIESLRSVSPGSDSVFYDETEGTLKDQQPHCLHCGKEMEGLNSVASAQAGDSAESIPCIANDIEQNIVKPPSDFADSPITTKTTQRLYKKMDKRFRSEDRYHGERGRHYRVRQENIRAKSEERNKENQSRSTQNLRATGSSPSVLPDVNFEHNQQIIYRGHYKPGRYCRLTDTDVWTQLDHQSFERQRGRSASTESEKSFHSKYQVILHRLVQRRCTLEMYQRQKNNKFRVDKTVVVKSDSGEFGFRIHGSKPVVVAAIEPDTPAESSGLEVGDILISVNGVQVLDKHHTEVVKIAHDGCETLELQVARTIGVLMSEQQEESSHAILSGYLWRQSGQAKGSPNAKKWVRRWFCLRPDNCLYYYKTENDNQPVGAMILAKHSIELCPPEIGKPFAFKVDSGEGIPLYVAADSEELTNRWINLLKQSAIDGSPWLDKCARNLYQPPGSIVRPDCFGYLLKLGSRWCGWSKRYCVLKDACLYFYQDAKSKSAFGMACLHGYKVASMSTNSSGKKNSFEIMPPDSKLRHYYFSTESDMDKKRWISALEYSIDRWIKSG